MPSINIALRRKCSFVIRKLNIALKLAIDLINKYNFREFTISDRYAFYPVLEFLRFREKCLIEKLKRSILLLTPAPDDPRFEQFIQCIENIQARGLKARMIISVLAELAEENSINGPTERLSFAKVMRQKNAHLELFMAPIPKEFAAPCLQPVNCQAREQEKNNQSADQNVLMESIPASFDAPCLLPEKHRGKNVGPTVGTIDPSDTSQCDPLYLNYLCTLDMDIYGGGCTWKSVWVTNEWILRYVGKSVWDYVLPWHPCPWYLRFRWKVYFDRQCSANNGILISIMFLSLF